MPIACARSIAFCRMSALSSSVGAMLTAASVMIKASSLAGHVHHEAVADAPCGAQARLPPDHGRHQLVGVQAALHQRLGLALAAPAAPPQRRPPRCAAASTTLDAGQIDPARRRPPGCGRRADQDRDDQAEPGRLHRSLQRRRIARVRDGGRRGRERLAGVRSGVGTSHVRSRHVPLRWVSGFSRIDKDQHQPPKKARRPARRGSSRSSCPERSSRSRCPGGRWASSLLE